MSMQISVDPAALSQEQREAVAGFILAYPSKACASTCHDHAVAEIPAFIHKDTADAGLVEVGKTASTFKAYQPQEATHVELEKLQHDQESTLPAAAFGNIPTGGIAYNDPPGSDPVAVFGVPPAPLAVSTPAIAAGSIVAPPPPANTAPITTTPGVASSVAGASSVDLDKHGLPWDNRIHAESKAKIADGTWRKKRNVDPGLVAQVEAELRQLMGAPAAPLAHSTAPIATTQAPATVAPVTANLPTASVSQPAVAPPPPAPVAGAAPTMPAAPNAAPAGEVPADARAQFVALVGRASAAIQGQKVTQAEVNQCCADAGVPALPLLANRLDLVAQVAAHIDALIAARQ